MVREVVFWHGGWQSGKPSWVKPADGMQSQCKARKHGREIKKKKKKKGKIAYYKYN